MLKIKPVLRLAGSKYNKIEKIIEILNIKKDDTFYDLFGGTGIVGVNVKHIIDCETIINDFDNVLPVSISYAIQNMISFEGFGKNFTKSALEYFNKRIDNGYWEKLEKYNDIINKCLIIKEDYKDVCIKERSIVYLDPPYFLEGDNLYKNKVNHQELKKYIDMLNKKNCKILISYNDNQYIRDLYKDYYIYTENYNYCTGAKTQKGRHKKQELFITNFELLESIEVVR